MNAKIYTRNIKKIHTHAYSFHFFVIIVRWIKNLWHCFNIKFYTDFFLNRLLSCSPLIKFHNMLSVFRRKKHTYDKVFQELLNLEIAICFWKIIIINTLLDQRTLGMVWWFLWSIRYRKSHLMLLYLQINIWKLLQNQFVVSVWIQENIMC